MKKIYTFLFLGSLLLGLACQSDTPKTDPTLPTTFANFYVRYLQSESQAQATATFTNGFSEEKATPLKLTKGVFFHEGNMKERDIKNIGTRYSYDYKGGFSDKFRFQFIEPNLGKMEQVLKMNPISNYAVKGKVSKSGGMEINWEGAPLNKNESLVFFIKGAANNAVTFEMKGPTTQNEIKVPAEKLNKVKVGDVKIYLVRKQAKTVEQPNFKGFLEMEFYTRETETTVLP